MSSSDIETEGPHASSKESRQQATANPNPSFATTLARGLKVLSAFRPGEDGLSNRELAGRTGLTRPTVSRLAHTLVELGFVRRNAAGNYKLSTRVLSIAYPLLAGLRIRQLARPLMREFASQALGTVSLAMPVGRQFIYIETVRTTHAVAHMPEIGFSGHMGLTAAGRALLSLYTQEEFDEYAKEMECCESRAWHTLET